MTTSYDEMPHQKSKASLSVQKGLDQFRALVEKNPEIASLLKSNASILRAPDEFKEKMQTTEEHNVFRSAFFPTSHYTNGNLSPRITKKLNKQTKISNHNDIHEQTTSKEAQIRNTSAPTSKVTTMSTSREKIPENALLENELNLETDSDSLLSMKTRLKLIRETTITTHNWKMSLRSVQKKISLMSLLQGIVRSIESWQCERIY